MTHGSEDSIFKHVDPVQTNDSANEEACDDFDLPSSIYTRPAPLVFSHEPSTEDFNLSSSIYTRPAPLQFTEEVSEDFDLPSSIYARPEPLVFPEEPVRRPRYIIHR